MVVRGHPSLSLTRQCRLLSIGRSSLYDRPKGESAETLALMRRIDALFLKYPFYGARQMVRHLRREGVRIGRRRAARLMRLLGLQAVYRAPRTSAPHLGHRVYPYLLRGLAIERPNHVWCADITYIPVRRGFLYLVAIMDWASRCVLAWRLSNTLDAGFCVEALDEALARHGTPQIFNTDQGSQFTGFAFTARLREAGIRISMDGRGRCMDNIFIERLWRSLKYEAVYLHEIADGFAARRVIGQWIGFYNTERPHSALGGRTPAEAYRGDTPVDMMDKPLRALTTYPQAQQQQQKDRSKRILAAQTSTGIHLENAVSLSDKPTPPQVAVGGRRRHRSRHRAVVGQRPALPGRGGDDVEQGLGVEPHPLGQREGLGHRDHRDAEDHVVAHLGGLAVAGPAGVHDVPPHRRHQRFAAGDGGRFAADHEGERAGPGPADPAGDRRVQHRAPPPADASACTSRAVSRSMVEESTSSVSGPAAASSPPSSQ